MRKIKEIRHGRNCVSDLCVHLVFVTKYRRGVLTEEMLLSLGTFFSKVCRDFEAELLECNGEDDHVHLLISYPPKASISKMVNSLKGASSRLLRRDFPEIQEKLWQNALWSPSYFAASCGGAPLEKIRKYIENQRS